MQAALAFVQVAFFPGSNSRYRQLDPIYPNGYEHSMTYTEKNACIIVFPYAAKRGHNLKVK